MAFNHAIHILQVNLSLILYAFFVVAWCSSVAGDMSFINMLNTKTPYLRVDNTDVKNHEDECPNSQLMHLDLVARHGARQPSSGDINSLLKLQGELNANGDYIGNSQFQWMKNWKSPYHLLNAGNLDPIGEVEHYNLSKRLLQKYKPLFIANYNPVIYPFQSTYVPRTSQSGSSFAYGLFEGRGVLGTDKFQPVSIVSQSPSLDVTLRFFDEDICPFYNQHVANNNSMNIDSELYIREYNSTILLKVIQKLKPSKAWNVTWNTVSKFYKACVFDLALFSDDSKFCQLFDKDDMSHFETYNDLSDYWIKGYGNSINYLISSPLLSDFWSSINAAAQKKTSELARLRFAHAETILPFASLLGLYSDNFVLRWNSPQLEIRKWRTSKISPFTSNIGMVLYDCNGILKVKLFHNEQDVPIPGCGGLLYCPLSTLSTLWHPYLTLNFNQLCGRVV